MTTETEEVEDESTSENEQAETADNVTDDVEEEAVDASDDTVEETTDESSSADSDVSESVTAIIDASVFQKSLDSVSALVDECKIHFEKDGIEIRAVDPANVGMVDLRLDATAFEAYNPIETVVGTNLDRLSQIANMAESDELMHLELLDTGKLNIKIGGITYNLALIDPDSIRDEPDIPDLELPAEITLEASELQRGIKAADMVSDHIALSSDAHDRTFNMSAEGDTDDVDLTIDEDDFIDLTPGDADSLYSLEYLQKMVGVMGKSTAVTLELGEEFPVKFHYDYADGTGHVTFMLAPRIQSE